MDQHLNAFLFRSRDVGIPISLEQDCPKFNSIECWFGGEIMDKEPSWTQLENAGLTKGNAVGTWRVFNIAICSVDFQVHFQG